MAIPKKSFECVGGTIRVDVSWRCSPKKHNIKKSSKAPNEPRHRAILICGSTRGPGWLASIESRPHSHSCLIPHIAICTTHETECWVGVNGNMTASFQPCAAIMSRWPSATTWQTF